MQTPVQLISHHDRGQADIAMYLAPHQKIQLQTRLQKDRKAQSPSVQIAVLKEAYQLAVVVQKAYCLGYVVQTHCNVLIPVQRKINYSASQPRLAERTQREYK